MAAGYSVIRAIDDHREQTPDLPEELITVEISKNISRYLCAVDLLVRRLVGLDWLGLDCGGVCRRL